MLLAMKVASDPLDATKSDCILVFFLSWLALPLSTAISLNVAKTPATVRDFVANMVRWLLLDVWAMSPRSPKRSYSLLICAALLPVASASAFMMMLSPQPLSIPSCAGARRPMDK